MSIALLPARQAGFRLRFAPRTKIEAHVPVPALRTVSVLGDPTKMGWLQWIAACQSSTPSLCTASPIHGMVTRWQCRLERPSQQQQAFQSSLFSAIAYPLAHGTILAYTYCTARRSGPCAGAALDLLNKAAAATSSRRRIAHPLVDPICQQISILNCHPSLRHNPWPGCWTLQTSPFLLPLRHSLALLTNLSSPCCLQRRLSADHGGLQTDRALWASNHPTESVCL